MPTVRDKQGGASLSVGSTVNIASTNSLVTVPPQTALAVIHGEPRVQSWLKIRIKFVGSSAPRTPQIQSAEPSHWGGPPPTPWNDHLFNVEWWSGLDEYAIYWSVVPVNPDPTPQLQVIQGNFNGVLNTGYTGGETAGGEEYSIWGFKLTFNGTPQTPANNDEVIITLTQNTP